MSKEMLVYMDAMAHARGVHREDVMQAVGVAIARALEKQHGVVHVTVRDDGSFYIVNAAGDDVSAEWGRQDANRVKMMMAQAMADLERQATAKSKKVQHKVRKTLK